MDGLFNKYDTNVVQSHHRTIIHIDMDYFYAQVEEIRNPSLKNKPFGVKQNNCVVTSNYVARSFGIRKMMYVAEAKKLCPQLILVNGEDLTPYRQMSNKISEVLHKYSAVVEKLGLDENFLDVSDVVNERLNGNFDENTFEIEGCIYSEEDESCSCGCNERLAIGSHIAKEIRQDLKKMLNITCSAGISFNKLLAKLVGNKNKPNNQTTLLSNSTEAFMRDLNTLSKVPGIGQKTESLLLESGISNITDLQTCDIEILKKSIGQESALKLKEWSFGRDAIPVKSSGKPKSIGLEDSCKPISVRRDVEDRYRLLLMRLVNQVSEDGRIPVTLKIIIRKFDSKKKTSHRETKQANILPSLFRILSDGKIVLAEGAQEKLLKIVMRLFERVVDMTKPFNITLLGLAFSKFQERKLGTSSIANFFIRRSDLEVQSVTSLTNVLQPAIPSQIPTFMDIDSVSDFSDFSETEIEPSPKKSKLGILIAKRRMQFDNDSASPSKLRVSELRLNSRDSDKEPISPVATAVPSRLLTKSKQTNNFAKISNECKTKTKETTKNCIEINNEILKKSTESSAATTVNGNLANNISCPSVVDPEVFKELPAEVQNELIVHYRNSLSTQTSTNGTNSHTNGARTIHRYFIKNK